MSAAVPAQISPVETREELLYLLTRASELEHDLACSYLYAGYSIKMRPEEGGVTHDELVTIRRWKSKIAQIAVEEMLHLGQVSNVLTAVGGAPHFSRSNFPLPASTFPFGSAIALEPLSSSLLERFVCYEFPEEGVLSPEQMAEFEPILKRTAAAADQLEMIRQRNTIEPFDIDFRTVGEFYHKIETAFKRIAADRLFIGDPAAQANPQYLDLPKDLVRVVDTGSASRAIEMIIEQGESPSARHPDAHFVVFDGIRRQYEELAERARLEGRAFEPFRPMIENPSTRGIGSVAGTNRITNAVAQELAGLFNSSYGLMLMMLARFFAHGDESEEEWRLLARGTLRIMASVLRPLGEALAKTPAGPEYPGLHAGPTFGFTGHIHLLPHKSAAWIYFLERLYDLSMRLTRLADEASLPQEVQEAAAALESVAEHLTPFIPARFAMGVRSEADERNERTTIRPEADGPYIVRNLRKLTNSKGETLRVRPVVALCRCGVELQAVLRRHARSHRFLQLKVDGSDTPDGAQPEEIEAIVRACPSGALGFVKDGAKYDGERREAEIYVAENASYYVRGGIDLEGEPMNKGALHEHYALCRCGQSKNKPFCDGSHWYAGFKDEGN